MVSWFQPAASIKPRLAAQNLGHEVVRVTYSLGPDRTDEPSLFFRILPADAYIREETIAGLTQSRIPACEARLDAQRNTVTA
jgi:hypothetical protein